MRKFAVIVFACLLASCNSSDRLTNPEKVGLKTFYFFDESRENWNANGPRPVTTYVWYPAQHDSEMSEIGIPSSNPLFTGGLASQNASMRADLSDTPLIMMSHGTGGSAMQMMWLGRRLAEQGYIAAAVDHHGNTISEGAYDSRGFRLFWIRSLDISFAIDQLLADSEFSNVIDDTKIAASGFSLGGHNAIALAGGRIDLDQFALFCNGLGRDANCDPQSEFPEAEAELQKVSQSDPRVAEILDQHQDSFRDTRISLVVSYAPAVGPAFTPESLKDIGIPVRIIAGGADDVAPVKTNAKVLTNLIPGAKLNIIDKEADHYAFLNTCTELGKRLVPICRDKENINRDELHTKAAGFLLRDLAVHFGKDR